MSEFKAAVAGESEAQWRQFMSYQFSQSSVGISTTGVLSGLAVAQTTTASANVLVDIGMALTQASLTAGVSPLLNNAQKTLDVLTANPMGATPRNDLVVFDPADSTIKVVVGTPNAVPTDPTPPTGSVSLARLRHAASATTVPTAKIDDLRAFTYWASTPTWQSYTPVWTGGSALSIGNGTLVGRFVDNGKLRRIHVELTRGSTTSVGTGPYSFTLPSGAYASSSQSGSGWFRDASPFAEAPLAVVGIGASTVALVTAAGARLTFNTIAWATGDMIAFDLFAELA